jgi:hypothetical protein
MSYSYQAPPGKDPQLWQLAQRRASFKSHFATYLVIIGLLWGIWFFTGGRTYGSGIPWPAWATLGWGIGIAFHFIGAYVNTRFGSADNEYEKLTKNQKL